MPRVHLPDGRVVNFPDGMSESDISKAMAEIAAPPKTIAAAPATTPEKHGGGLVDALPTIGGTVFSLAGGSKALPTGMALGALGGALGEGAREVIRAVQGQWDQVPDTVVGRLKKMGTEAVGQGAMEGAGRGAAALVAPVAKAAYGLALRPAKALQKEYGLLNIVEQGFKDRVMPSASGAQKAGTLVGQSRDAATKIAADNPQTFNLQRVLQRAVDDQAGRAEKEFSTAGVPLPTDKVATQIGNVLGGNPAEVSASRLLEMRRGADEIANPAFKQARLPGGAGRVPAGTEASIARSMSNAERQTLDDALGQKFRDANATTRARMGVMQAAKDAGMRPNMLTNLISGGVGASALNGGDVGDAVQRGLIFRALLSPSVQAGASFALPAVAKYGPRVVDAVSGGTMKDALIQALMRGQQP